MSLQDLGSGDFEYYKRRATKMRACHESEFILRNDPLLMSAFYRGLNRKYQDDIYSQEFYTRRENFLTLSRIFTATNTLGPQLYYQNPQPIVLPMESGTKEGAANLSAALRKNMIDNDAESQNPEACLSAWFFGMGWKKIGLRNTFIQRDQNPESTAQPGQQLDRASEVEPVRSDYLTNQSFFNDSENPMNVMLDDETDLRNGKLRLHRIKRSLYDLNNSGAYDEKALQTVYEKLKNERGSRLDSREIKVDLNELEIKFPTGIWICSWVDQCSSEPLRYDLSSYQEGFQLEPLVFTNEPFVRYPIAHMKVASQVQAHLDNMATVFLKIVDRVRNQILVNKQDLAPGMENALQQNKLGGIIFTNKPINAGTYQQLTSAAVTNDLPLLMNVVQQNLTEILGADSQLIGGSSKNDTLGQDELARVGTKVRESGMNEKVRKLMVRQFRHEAALMQQYALAPMTLKLTQRDYPNISPGARIADKFQSFATPENPMPFKESVPGKYDYDLNIYEAVKPDKKVLQEEYLNGIQIFSSPAIQQAGAMAGVKFRVDKLAEGYAENFEYLKSKDFVEILDPMQQAAYQASLMMMGGQMNMGTPAKPKISGAAPEKNEQDVSHPSSQVATA